MLDFSETAVTSWLRELCPSDNPTPPIRPVEIEATASLAGLATTIEATVESCNAEALVKALSEPPLRDDLRAVLAQTGSARMLRLLHWLGERVPNPSAVATGILDGNGHDARALQAGVAETTRHAVLCRMFSQHRFEQLQQACTNAGKETA